MRKREEIEDTEMFFVFIGDSVKYSLSESIFLISFLSLVSDQCLPFQILCTLPHNRFFLFI